MTCRLVTSVGFSLLLRRISAGTSEPSIRVHHLIFTPYHFGHVVRCLIAGTSSKRLTRINTMQFSVTEQSM
jgi:hypothetical protein